MDNTNITQKWMDYLESEHSVYKFGQVDDLLKLKFKVGDINRSVLINEAENWFVLESSWYNQVALSSADWETIVMELNEDLPIGYFMIVEVTPKDARFNEDYPTYKKKLVYKTHQRFTRNNDDYNIKRTIELLSKDHDIYFNRFVSEIKNSGSIINESEVKRIFSSLLH